VSISAAVRLLQSAGLKATPQRLLVLDALRQLSHPDVDAIFRHAVAHHAGLSLATVYHVLEKFEQAGLIVQLEFNGRRYYDIRRDAHDHVRCRRCGRLDDVNRDPRTRLVFTPGSAWVVESQSLLWEGICPDCQASTMSREGDAP
jgi:Fe2+ or Zn2+ uptake regulation protein